MTARDVIRDWIYSDTGPDALGRTSVERANSLLTALESAGYVVVPVEPTKEMIERGEATLEDHT